ncbi:hypothetical protein NIES37_38670 [Tolypothrix tenuis PCC 7101]|uniref:Uncharacterized protein n=1 Tax=Tolypothrix tenuis PCC 7101 TaxID=231146 RepID=A0A1Z4N2F3_9CYAN|nr:hypothetical protein NIES37_38670 [Tolypothrix tenuis PCC 7101]BAZ76194.1 hypothetical protein NIES50_47920 [Aulosira laxa NIES-50]
MGLLLDDYSNTWNYTVVFDYPQGFCEEFIEEDLAALDELLFSKLELKLINHNCQFLINQNSLTAGIYCQKLTLFQSLLFDSFSVWVSCKAFPQRSLYLGRVQGTVYQ